MNTVKDIGDAVASLPPEELAAFRTWLEAFDAERFDEKIERDAKSGRLDQLADKAMSDFRAGRAREGEAFRERGVVDAPCHSGLSLRAAPERQQIPLDTSRPQRGALMRRRDVGRGRRLRPGFFAKLRARGP